MASPAILKIDIIADATKAIKAMEDTGGAAKTAGSKFGGMAKAVGGAVAVGSVVAFGKASFGAAEESAQATERLEAVFAAMGDTTGQAAKQSEQYAATLGKQIAVDDDLIKTGQAQLATFSEVSSETARAAGIFDRATAAGADLAAAGFGAIDTNAVQLGKALNDPIKGMSALAESGVTFTDAQKEQITAMQESGDMLGAQNVVLAAVEGQVKGTAAATVTSSDKMAAGFEDVQEQVGSFLLPAMTKLTDIFVKYKDIILPVGAALVAIVAAVKAYELGAKAVKVAQQAWNIVQGAFNLVMAANPIVLVVLAIAALVAAVILAYNKVEWFRNFVDAAFDVIVKAFNFLKEAAEKVFNWVKDNWPLLLAILTGPFGIAILAITKNWDTIKEGAQKVWEWVRDQFNKLLDFITGLGEKFMKGIEKIVGFFTAIKDAATEVWDWVKDKFDDLVDYFTELPGRFVEALKNLAQSFKNIFKAAFNGIANIWNDTVGSLRFEIPGWVPGIGGKGFDVPDIPTLAAGGTVARTGLAVVHAGEMFSGVGRTFSGGGNVTINVTTTGLGADAPSIQRAVANALRGYTARNGPLDIPVRGVA